MLRLQVRGALWPQASQQGCAQQFALPVAAQAPGEDAGAGQAIERRPRLGAEAQQGELGRRPRAEAGDDGVDAIRVALQRGQRPRRQRGQLTGGAALQAHRAAEAICFQALAAEQFGQAPLGHAPAQLHLPQAVLGMNHALGKPQIGLAAGVDVRDAPAIAQHFHRGLQAGQAQAALVLRQGTQHHPGVDDDQAQGQEAGDDEQNECDEDGRNHEESVRGGHACAALVRSS